MAKKRSIKVYGQSGYKYRETPTITLKGMWLREAGFDIGDYISVICEDGKLIITQDAERAAVKAAEAEFMERLTDRNLCLVYHKHKITHPYHSHARCGTLRKAIKDIKSHDRFQLNGRKPVYKH